MGDGTSGPVRLTFRPHLRVEFRGARLVLPVAIQSWFLTSLQQRLFQTSGRLFT